MGESGFEVQLVVYASFQLWTVVESSSEIQSVVHFGSPLWCSMDESDYAIQLVVNFYSQL